MMFQRRKESSPHQNRHKQTHAGVIVMLCVPARVSLITALPRPAEQMSLPAALGAPEWLPASCN